MAAPSLTYTLTNGSTADASQVMQDFNDLLNGITDGTKDLSISALTCAGTATLNGNINLGNAAGDDLTVTASLASNFVPKTDATYALGSSTIGFSGVYLGRNSQRVRLIPNAATSASYDLTLPVSSTGTSAWLLGTAGALSFGHTTTVGKTIDGTADEVQLLVQGHSTQTNEVFICQNSAATNVFKVENDGTTTSATGLKVATTGGTPSVFNYYEETTHATTFTANGTGSPGTSSSVTLRITRIGNFVSIFVPTFNATTGTTTTSFSADTVLLARFRPSATTNAVHGGLIRNNAATGTQIPMFQITSAGAIVMARSAAVDAFTNTASAGLAVPATFSYYIGTGS